MRLSYLGSIAARRRAMASAAGGGGGGDPADPYFSSVSSLSHYEDAGSPQGVTDVKGKVWTLAGNAKCSVLQAKWGTSSLALDGTGDYISTPDHADFEMGSGDFTLECWVRFAALPSPGTIASFFTKFSSLDHSFFLGLQNNAGTYNLLFAGSDDNDGVNEVLLTGAWTPSLSTWYHVAHSKTGGNSQIYADGARKAIGTDGITYYNNANPVIIGASNGGANNLFSGHIDDSRITKGVGRYTGTTITVPTASFPDS